MKISMPQDIDWTFDNSENVGIGWTKNFDFKDMNLIHAKIRPKETLKMHYHERDGGSELFCFYKGGHFKVKTKDEEQEFNEKDVIYISFEDKEAHSIENLSKDELEFQAFYSPPFKMGEVKQ